jgi:PIN domain nuclease of toxin-antitoxin system
MKLLVDTHILVWAAGHDREGLEKRAPGAHALVNDPANQPMFSVASLWEIVIKAGAGRPDFGVEPHLLRRNLMDNGWTELPISSAHVLGVATLPQIHKDPFDRLLVAQATVEGVILLTSDAVVAKYPGPIRKV